MLYYINVMKEKLLFIYFCFVLLSCEKIQYKVVECPPEIRTLAVSYAQKYAERETEFALGGRDYLENEGILQLDCSGFIVRIFNYAAGNSKYSLLFEDAPLSAFYQYFTIPLEQKMLTPGDIIFMGTPITYELDEADLDFRNLEIILPPTHMSVFAGMDDENIYFIDATIKEQEGINGVSLRYYPKNDQRFMSYGRLLIRF